MTHNLETTDIADHVSNFLDKIWEARDIESIESFVDSMDIRTTARPNCSLLGKRSVTTKHNRARSNQR